MRTIERSSTFKRDYKRIKATPHYSKNLDRLVSHVFEFLLADKVLPKKKSRSRFKWCMERIPRMSYQTKSFADLQKTRSKYIVSRQTRITQ